MRYPVSCRSCFSNRLGTIKPSLSRKRSTTLTFGVLSFKLSRKCRGVSPSGLPASTSSTHRRCRAKVAALRRIRWLWEISGVSFQGRIRWPHLGGASFDSTRCRIYLGPVFRLLPIDRYWVTTNFAETAARGAGRFGRAQLSLSRLYRFRGGKWLGRSLALPVAKQDRGGSLRTAEPLGDNIVGERLRFER
jgi:hypothetical protein